MSRNGSQASLLRPCSPRAEQYYGAGDENVHIYANPPWIVSQWQGGTALPPFGEDWGVRGSRDVRPAGISRVRLDRDEIVSSPLELRPVELGAHLGHDLAGTTVHVGTPMFLYFKKSTHAERGRLFRHKRHAEIVRL